MLHPMLAFFLWLLGLCVGSFLNVVVYRLPRGASITNPPRSFCPRCQARIAWYDNLPVLSWLLLRGRCRHCAGEISVQYPLVEAVTGLTFVLVYHLLFVAQARVGLSPALLPQDVPLLLSWLALAAALVACSAMDIVSYMIDVRVTLLVVVIGLVAHAVWPRPDFLTPTTAGPGGAATVALFIAGVVVIWLERERVPDTPAGEPVPETPVPPPDESAPAARRAGWFGTGLFVALALGLLYVAATAASGRGLLIDVGSAAALLTIFAATVIVGGQQRAADEEIREAIEAEQPEARRTALRELRHLLPGLVAGGLVFALFTYMPVAARGWQELVRWSPGSSFVPIAGVVYAMQGAMAGAIAGWTLRILFTLAFGREAFGVGDIYILAAAGAAAGGDLVLLGLLLSVGIALLGWMLGLLMKSSVMIPFGPWLAIGFVLALCWNEPAAGMAREYGENLSLAWRQRPDLVMVAVGLMLVATAAAMTLARLVRRWVEPG